MSRTDRLSRESGITFLEYTPERRAGVLELKIMFDEAARLREEDNIVAYANQIADIEVFYAKLNPSFFHRLAQAEKSASFARSMASPLNNPNPQWRKKSYTYLEGQISSLARMLLHFENELRIGFRAKLTLPPGLVNYK